MSTQEYKSHEDPTKTDTPDIWKFVFFISNSWSFKSKFYNYRWKIIPIIWSEFFAHLIIKNLSRK